MFLVAILLLLVLGCAGGESHSAGAPPVEPGLEVVLPEVVIRFCPVDRELQGDDWLQCPEMGGGILAGKAVFPTWVYVPAWRRPDGRIEVDFHVLGHEIWHLVYWQYPDLASDPDE